MKKYRCAGCHEIREEDQMVKSEMLGKWYCKVDCLSKGIMLYSDIQHMKWRKKHES